MESLSIQDVFGRIQKHIGAIGLITVIGILVALGISLVLPRQYRAESTVFLYEKLGADTDPYTAQRAVESRVEVLISLAFKDSFFSKFVSKNVDIRNRFPSDDVEERRKMYERDIIIESDGNGFVSIRTYDASADLALEMNKSVVTVLSEEAKGFFGDSVQIQTVNAPALYDGIGRPNIVLNLLAGAVLGLLIGASFAISRSPKSKSIPTSRTISPSETYSTPHSAGASTDRHTTPYHEELPHLPDIHD